jgi:hypothetical protein
MSYDMTEVLAGILGRLERIAQALEALGTNSGPGSGAVADANPGAAPGGDSGPGPGDEPTESGGEIHQRIPPGESAAAGFGWCGSCGCASSTDAQSCEGCGAGLAPGALTN